MSSYTSQSSENSMTSGRRSADPINGRRSDPNNGRRSVEVQKRRERVAKEGRYQDAEKESNIQVVIRSRGRNDKELRENSPSAIQCDSLIGSEIALSAGHYDKTARTYTFDKVFGPEATQEHVYDNVVKSFLEEVIMGYNCTIFAYGQTGTGKTYTMEGNLEEVNSSFSKDAGIIPRTLHRLFERLESETADYSVRLSFIELYNEELKDLLAPDEDPKRLKIFEDITRKGSIVIHGLEEFSVNNAMDGVQLLRKGSFRRKIAATKCNDKSSRSHSVFSITVHIKETTPGGEELLKVGKLNLVDLAGSENIGRSGAENKRAREAGMINQSLLTLGRVINSLVEKSPHIPYRESKLTRLLQDSLGGKTKTCIIATVSPARINFEETLSTLEYAIRAKSIRNKPEVNQKLTKIALIKEYVDEIDRLKSELMATRDKNGVYLTSDNYQSLVDENESNKELVDELKKSMETVQEQLTQITDEFKQKMDLLNRTSERLATTEKELEVTAEYLQATSQHLEVTKQTLEEQKILTEAHTETESMLNSLANGLVSTLKSSVEDCQHLHAKIDRKSAIEMENRRLFKEFQQSLTSQSEDLEAEIEEFKHEQNTFMDSCISHLQEFVGQKLQELVQQETSIDEATQAISQRHLGIEKHMETFASTTMANHQHVSESHDTLKTSVQGKAATFQQVGNDLFETFRQELLKYHNGFMVWQQKMEGSFQKLANNSKSQMAKQSELIASLNRMVQTETEEEIQKLRKQNEELSMALTLEKEKNGKSKQQLLSSITVLIQDHSAKRHESLKSAMGQMEVSLSKNSTALDNFKTCFNSMSSKASTEITSFTAKIDSSTQQVLDEITAGSKHIESYHSSNTVLADGTRSQLIAHVENSQNVVGEQLKKIENVNLELLDESHKYHNGHMKATQDLRSSISQKLNSSRSADVEMQSELSSHKNEMISDFSTLTDSVSTMRSLTDDHLSHTKSTIDHLVDQDIRVDESTGTTPKRRKFNYENTWSLTRPHQEILEERRHKSCKTADSQ
ncbi:Kinesin- motor protein [Basidiobolus ranarum]|uniref:Kinesin- motor protein n=1 Tax=Basidiobolus ranarum TaxID=34480 RepID=A0ABR2W567_9FUNG